MILPKEMTKLDNTHFIGSGSEECNGYNSHSFLTLTNEGLKEKRNIHTLTNISKKWVKSSNLSIDGFIVM